MQFEYCRWPPERLEKWREIEPDGEIKGREN